MCEQDDGIKCDQIHLEITKNTGRQSLIPTGDLSKIKSEW